MSAPGTQEPFSPAAEGSAYGGAADGICSRAEFVSLYDPNWKQPDPENQPSHSGWMFQELAAVPVMVFLSCAVFLEGLSMKSRAVASLVACVAFVWISHGTARSAELKIFVSRAIWILERQKSWQFLPPLRTQHVTYGCAAIAGGGLLSARLALHFPAAAAQTQTVSGDYF
jgi:hypothetical protein